MKNLRFAIYASILCLALFGAFAGTAMADTCTGNCGTSGANGVVGLSPSGNSSYQWVSTTGGVSGVGAIPVGALQGNETDGSTLATSLFAVNANSTLNFFFDYVTSDGSGFPDYAWAELFNGDGTPAALIFTAQTEASGVIVPAPGLQQPAPGVTLNPTNVLITPNATTWSPLGTWSGTCFAVGCGNTGWVNSTFNIANAGTYFLEFGVVNANDGLFDSGLAFDGVTINGVPINPPPTSTPEPGSMALLGIGVLGLAAVKLSKR